MSLIGGFSSVVCSRRMGHEKTEWYLGRMSEGGKAEVLPKTFGQFYFNG